MGATGRPISWSWLYEMHKINPEDRSDIARLTGAVYRWKTDNGEGDDDDEEDGLDEEADNNEADVMVGEPIPPGVPMPTFQTTTVPVSQLMSGAAAAHSSPQ